MKRVISETKNELRKRRKKLACGSVREKVGTANDNIKMKEEKLRVIKAKYADA